MSAQLQGVKTYGVESNPCVVLLHSSMSSGRQWTKLIQRLEERFYVINFDLLGYGTAPEVGDSASFSLSDETDRIRQNLASMEIDSFDLIGHSYGGAVALKFTFENRNEVKRLVLFEPVAFHLLNKQSENIQEIKNIGQEMLSKGAEHAAKTFVDYWNGPGFFASLPDPMQSLLMQQAPKVSLDFKGLIAESYELSDYQDIQQLTLLMHGKYSRKPSLELAAQLQAILPNCEGIETEGGHMAPISHGQSVNALIHKYLID